MKKYIIFGAIFLNLSINLFAVENKTDVTANQQKIDSFVNKIVEEKNENLIKQARFDKEYLAYLRSKEKAKNKKIQENSSAPRESGITGFSMTR